MTGQVLSTSQTFAEAIKQLQDLWGQWPFHFSLSSQEALESLERAFVELAQGDLSTAQNAVSKREGEWAGRHTVSMYVNGQDGNTNTLGEYVEIDGAKVRLITRATDDEHNFLLIVSLNSGMLESVERRETIENLGKEPVTVAHLMITFQGDQITSFQEERFWKMRSRR